MRLRALPEGWSELQCTSQEGMRNPCKIRVVQPLERAESSPSRVWVTTITDHIQAGYI
jgi:hypothetical protein